MKVYAGRNKDLKTRLKSSSGGIFPLLAEHIINNKGVVYGASYDGLEVKHIKIEQIEDIPKLQGSKYVESNIKGIYNQVKQDLQKGIVLFSGTPCQVKALKNTIESDNLYCVDNICHGTPKIEEYNKYITSLNGLVEINFRDKAKSWKQYEVKKIFKDRVEKELYIENQYMKDFIQDKILNDKCFNCKSKEFTSGSDIKLGDYWGTKQLDDDKGTSAIMIITSKGEYLFNSIKDKIDYEKTDIENIIKHNPYLVTSARKE